ncbi:unnamed protein product [Bursaphelenchus okinawaensis]|uniref:Uncharacterized protein n=1 Tax=Bursaphelenchus okinawaensis TaxID=465554 RepID=A0A811KV90_9BILA|nr:unnamed protein product [Bursaphelenchus okinawaensis]CAD5218923.1 unnamed protein product [Bursaphelenchus okinawaensis]CAG9112128.1 unnamed protein product [Bursaphelenchus okinawaensis]CAG9112130.1 unnamed protein product [Bursaphelenchus okinawaensis]
MRAFSIVLLLCIAAGITAQFCSKGSSFSQDSKTRQGSCGTLLNGGAKSPSEVKGPTQAEKDAAGCLCGGSESSHESHESGESRSKRSAEASGSEESTTAEATTEASVEATSASGSEESSGSGSSSGSEEASGSGSGSEESGSGSGSYEASGSGSGSEEASGSGSYEASGSGSGSYEASGSGSYEASGSGGCVCSGSGSGTISAIYGKEDFCLLFQYFLEITVQLGDESIQEAWIELLNTMQVEIIFDASLTVQQQLSAIYGEISVFMLTYPSCASVINNIYVTEWNGYVFNLEELAVDSSYEVSETIIELDATGNCALFEALRNASAGTSFEAQVETLIASLTVTIQGSSSFSVQCAGIYSQLVQFFATYSGSESILCGGEIEGYGPVSIFLAVSGNYFRIQNFAVAVGGSASSCELVAQLNATVYNVNAGSTSERAQLKELVEDLVTNFASLSVEARVEYFISAFYQFLIIQDWSITITFGIELKGFGTIGELIAAECFEQQYGAVSTTVQVATTTEEAEETTVSTSKATTTAATTAGTTAATTAKPGSCATAAQLLTKGSNSNTSLTISIQQSFSTTTWTAQQKTSFSAYFKNIITLQTQYTGQTCINKVANVLLNWTKDAASITATKSVQIYFYASNAKTTYWGTVGQFCSCATS